MKYTPKELCEITGLTLNAIHKRLSRFRQGKIDEAGLLKPKTTCKPRPPKKINTDYEQKALAKIPGPSELERKIFG